MPNNNLSVLYKHIVQVENKNVGLKVGGGGAQTYHCLPIYIYIYIYIYVYILAVFVLYIIMRSTFRILKWYTAVYL